MKCIAFALRLQQTSSARLSDGAAEVARRPTGEVPEVATCLSPIKRRRGKVAGESARAAVGFAGAGLCPALRTTRTGPTLATSDTRSGALDGSQGQQARDAVNTDWGRV